MFLFRRQTSPKSEILRSVYEDNLRIVGKGRLVSKWKFPYFIKGYLFFSLLLLLILGNADHLDSFFTFNVPEKQPSPSLDESIVPSEYMSMIAGNNIPVKQMFGLGVRTIIIDPGHGGTDSGAKGKQGIAEKDIALDIAKRLRKKLAEHGKFNVILTRERDQALPLTKRSEIANGNRADLFVSIHVNYVPLKPLNIIETYYFGPSEDTETLQLATEENADSHYRLGEFKEMVKKIGSTLKLQESKKLASFIQDSLYLNIRGQNGSVQDRGIKRAPFVVLMGIDMPGVLAEVSCLSNRTEETNLQKESYRDDIARYLESGIMNYLKKGEPVYEASR